MDFTEAKSLLKKDYFCKVVYKSKNNYSMIFDYGEGMEHVNHDLVELSKEEVIHITECMEKNIERGVLE